MANTCEIPNEIVEEFKKFKLGNKVNYALIFRINKNELKVELDQSLENISIEGIQEYLPESAPRYIAYSYKYIHEDGRQSLPLIFIFYCPRDINPTLSMMYTSTKTRLINAFEIQKTFDVQHLSTLNESWLKEKLKFFK